ncbi:metallophosphoesterase [Lysinibacillus sp. 54212]|uniref:metallophosphoesterase n=1 Tax=Lysinibacillus sp. 54212 TaxID=3119829 RepID=UPI002FC60FE8
MTRILYALMAIGIYSGITFYLGWNLKKWLVAINLFRLEPLYWIVLFVISFGFVLGRIHDILKPLSVVGSYWMFFLQYGLAICIIMNLVMWLTPYKNVVVLGSVGVATLLVLFVIGTYNAYSPVVRELTITVDKEGEPLRVVVASDFHLGVLSNKRHLQKFVNLSNEAHPDVVLLVGDLVDDDPVWFVQDGMHEVMKGLQSSYGVYGVLGNHEYYGGEIPLLIEEMEASNVKMLLDETIFVANRFYLTGQEDLTNKSRKTLSSLKPENETYPWFVMNHTPNDLETPAAHGVDFHVSGHTHKGQMWPNSFITSRIFEVDYGHKHKESMHTLVSSGFGFWGPPTRVGSRSELWVVDINFTK